MKISGFTIVRNAIKYDYPAVEAIRSILPLCDEVVVAVGQSDDGTLDLIRSIGSPKIRIVETVWDDTLREGGRVLAVETDKALAAVAPDADWAVYIQADEVIHEQYLPVMRQAMETHLHDQQVEGLLLKYLHFYGSYAYVGDSARWYRREIRVVRPKGQVASYRDAQGFRTPDDRKLRVRLIDAYVYHYGWVRTPDQMRQKLKDFPQYWYNDTEMQAIRQEAEAFDYSQVDSLAAFRGTHPQVMHARIERMSWVFDFDIRQKRMPLKYRLKHWIERLTGWLPGEYRNYELLK